MQSTVKARHMDMTAPLHAYAREKLVDAITRVFDDSSAAIDVDLVDMAHAKHGVRMECNVRVLMPTHRGHRDNVVIQEADDNMYKAIDRAHDRLLLQVKRHRDKQRGSSHRRKNAALERAVIARQELTQQPEAWELETRAYENARAGARA